MSRQRGARQQEKEIFLQENPTLIRSETQIEVAQDDKDRHVLKVTQDKDEPVLTEAPSFRFYPPQGSLPDLISVEGEVEGPNFDLTASYTSVDWRGNEREKGALVALSDLGIGVTSGKDVSGLIKAIIKKDVDESDLERFASASSEESLMLDIGEESKEGNLISKELSFLDHGGKSIGIDFDILSGSGKIEVVLYDAEAWTETVLEFDTVSAVSRGRSVELDHIEAMMSEGKTFEQVEIRTTGDLEIAVTGIGLSTGYVEDSFLPI